MGLWLLSIEKHLFNRIQYFNEKLSHLIDVGEGTKGFIKDLISKTNLKRITKD